MILNSPKLKVFFTKLRFDSNNTLEVSDKKYQSGECPQCNITQNVEHIILNCRHPDMVSNRKMFVEKYIQYAISFKDKHQAGKVKEIINFNPSNKEDKAIKTICMYVKKKLYWIIGQKVNNT